MPTQPQTFAEDLIRWYQDNKRDLPWRSTKDPYHIWLSEIILQQTRVDQGTPYYLKYVENFEDIHALACATEDEVLRLWQGLGYYTRARNLHACAKEVSQRGGEFPRKYDELLKLPGIGPYTAAAIASIAFDEPVAVVDGNVFRVLSRIFGIHENIADPKTRIVFVDHANRLMGGSSPSLFNQAMMEFGATYCKPKRPDCETCLFQEHCHAYENDAQGELPFKKSLKRIRTRNLHYIVAQYDNSLLMKKRAAGDVWQGLYDFPLMENDSLLDDEEAWDLIRSYGLSDFTIIESSKAYKHILTHQRINARFFRIELNDPNFVQEFKSKLDLELFNQLEIDQIPKPRLIDRFLTDANFYLT